METIQSNLDLWKREWLTKKFRNEYAKMSNRIFHRNIYVLKIIQIWVAIKINTDFQLYYPTNKQKKSLMVWQWVKAPLHRQFIMTLFVTAINVTRCTTQMLLTQMKQQQYINASYEFTFVLCRTFDCCFRRVIKFSKSFQISGGRRHVQQTNRKCIESKKK